MRYPVKETAERHQRIVLKASQMFRERGFDDVTVAEVMNAAGLTHGAFYSHFDSKEDLMAAATEYAMKATRQALTRNFESEAGRASYIDRYLSRKHKDNSSTGCAMAALSGEMRHEPVVKDIFTAELKEVVAAIGGHRNNAILTVAALVGAMTLARAVSDETFSQDILQAVRQELSK